MAVRSRRIFGPTQLAASSITTIYTVPSGRTAVFRSIFVLNNSGTPSLVRLRVNGTTGPFLVWAETVPANGTIVLPDEMVLNPGDVLNAQTVTAGNSTVWLGTGSLLEGAPE